MVDPSKITNFHLTSNELEEVILWWVLAAGKNGMTAARCLEQLLKSWEVAAATVKAPTPFDIVRFINNRTSLAEEMRKHGIGCYNNKSKTLNALVWSGLNLRTCTVDDLEKIPGIGPKTARCFLIHSRENQKYAGLDTHVLKFLRDKGHKVPKSTPTGRKYKELEQEFLKYVEESGMSVSELDLKIWNSYRSQNERTSNV